MQRGELGGREQGLKLFKETIRHHGPRLLATHDFQA